MISKYKELSDLAFKFHSSNQLEKAEELYKQLLVMQPDDVNVLNLLGMLYISLKKNNLAIEFLSKAFILKKSSYVAANLAKAYYINSEYNNAISIYNKALEYGETDDVHYSLGIAYKKIGDSEKVIFHYKKAIELNPCHYNSTYNLVVAYKDINDIDNAILYAEKALSIKNDDVDLYTLISNLYEIKSDYKSAIFYLNKAVELFPDNYLFYYNLGVLNSRLKKKKEAISYYLKSIKLNKSHIESYVNLASLYKSTDNNRALLYLQDAYSINKKEENLLLSLAQTYRDLYMNNESIEILNECLLLNKNSAEAYSLLAMNYMDLFSYDTALSFYNKAIFFNPKNNNYLHGKAIALKYLGKIKESKQILEKIVENDSSMTQSAITLGMMYLTDKNFEKGMPLYRKRAEESKFFDVFSNKIWDKSVDISEKNLLIYSDCGLGDTIMYFRYLSYFKKIVKQVILQTDKELVPILSKQDKDIIVIPKGKKVKYDVVMPLMDVQYALDMNFNKIPMPKRYIRTKKVIENIEEIKNNNKKIGLFWQGNKRIFKNRSISFEKIKKVIDSFNYSFYSFQIDLETEQSKNFYSLKKYISDYEDTAFLLKQMDCLITIDSSIVHMAGALGVKTFLLLPKIAEWRWFDDTQTTPWYDSVKIIRQEENDQWDSVIDSVVEELNKL